jgi:uncharacterized protein (DUF433 family)
MPIYACYQGDCSNLAIEQPGCYMCKDARGNDWFCADTGKDLLSDVIPSAFEGIEQAQQLARKAGFNYEGTSVTFIDATDPGDLQRQLVRRTYPPEEPYKFQLRYTGWYSFEQAVEGDSVRATAHRGGRTLTASGESASEAWFRLAEKALKEEPVVDFQIESLTVPMRWHEGGVLRVGNSRVSLDVVVNEHLAEKSPEEIVRSYPTLSLPDVYAVIAYYPGTKDPPTPARRASEGIESIAEIPSLARRAGVSFLPAGVILPDPSGGGSRLPGTATSGSTLPASRDREEAAVLRRVTAQVEGTTGREGERPCFHCNPL